MGATKGKAREYACKVRREGYPEDLTDELLVKLWLEGPGPNSCVIYGISDIAYMYRMTDREVRSRLKKLRWI